MLSGDRLALYPRTVVELGMGDGTLLESLANEDSQSLYVGIEIDKSQFEKARSKISASNAELINGSFELVVPTLPDDSVDLFLAILPDPYFIDPAKYDGWKHFYRRVHAKLKPGGTFRLVTELTDELLEPVSDKNYQAWIAWLRQAFLSLGFSIAHEDTGGPADYHSHYLDQFRGDSERIRMVTIDFTKS